MASSDTNRNIVAALAYIPYFGIIVGIAILIVEKENKFIRFHALQSVLASGALYLFSAFFAAFSKNLSFLGILLTFLNSLINITAWVFWISSMIRAYQGKIFKWPIVGDFAERQVGKAF